MKQRKVLVFLLTLIMIVAMVPMIAMSVSASGTTPCFTEVPTPVERVVFPTAGTLVNAANIQGGNRIEVGDGSKTIDLGVAMSSMTTLTPATQFFTFAPANANIGTKNSTCDCDADVCFSVASPTSLADIRWSIPEEGIADTLDAEVDGNLLTVEGYGKFTLVATVVVEKCSATCDDDECDDCTIVDTPFVINVTQKLTREHTGINVVVGDGWNPGAQYLLCLVTETIRERCGGAPVDGQRAPCPQDDTCAIVGCIDGYVVFNVETFSIDGGTRWRAVHKTRGLELGRLLNRATNLVVSSSRFPTSQEAHARTPTVPGAARGRPLPGGIELAFGQIAARPRAARLLVNYDLRAANGTLVASPTALTPVSNTWFSDDAPHGMWALTTRDKANEHIDYRLFQIAPQPANRNDTILWRGLDNATLQNFAIEPTAEIEATASIRTVLGSGDRPVRTRFLVRTASVRGGTAAAPIFTPASGQARINVSSALRAPNIKSPTRPTLTVRPNTILVSGAIDAARMDTATNLNTGANNPPVNTTVSRVVGLFTARTVISTAPTTDLGPLVFRTAPTVRRPASMPISTPVTIPGAPAATPPAGS
jgi:hypothetical protein